MKTKIIKLFVVLSFLIFLVTITYKFRTIQTNNLKREEETDDLKIQIPIISDIHIGAENQALKFEEVLNQYKKLAPNYDAIAMVGDITNNGDESQYDTFMKILNKNISPNAEKIITIGNHEYYDQDSGLTDADLKNRFIEKTDMSGIYYDKWIKGYHFIALGGEESAISNKENGDNAIISDTQYAWLEKTIAKDTANNKPIFVFLHQPINNTVYGSEQWGGTSDNKLKKILQKYPQTILFSGHSHYLLSHPKTVYQDKFTMVNTGGLLDTYYDDGFGPNLVQGLLVNIYSDRVEIKAREFTSNAWVNSYTIKVPFEKTVYDTEKPIFADTASVKVDKLSVDSATISWNSATDNTQVDNYIIKENGDIIGTKYVKFWEDNKNDLVSIDLSKLKESSVHNLKIYAVDAWGNISNNPLQIKFTTL